MPSIKSLNKKFKREQSKMKHNSKDHRAEGAMKYLSRQLDNAYQEDKLKRA